MKNIGDARELFRSTAYYYARYRTPYPVKLLDRMRARFKPDGTGRLLDIGCGTGQLVIPLSEWFSQVVALDASGEMVHEAESAARQAGRSNIEFRIARAEEFSATEGSFSLITFGQSLHWMDIDAVTAKCRTLLAPAGGAAIVGSRSIWGGETDWEQAVVATVQKWLGEERRAGSGSFGNPAKPFSEALADAGFTDIERGELPTRYELDIPFITGHLYSTSYCNRALLGDRAYDFEKDLQETLLAINPSGRFTWEPNINYLFASAP